MTDSKSLPTYWGERVLSRKEKRDGDHRSPYQRDKARVLHSAAFRRLQAKTQVLGVGLSDFYRTRLTHSLEASQIGNGICGQLEGKYPELTAELELDSNLIEALCLAHDIGHPPFGHGGEVALNYMMLKNGGFEGNGQTFRIVTKLEPYTEHQGMNLSRRTILGLIKYPGFVEALQNYQQPIPHELHANRRVEANLWHPPKALFSCDKDMFDWLVNPLTEGDKALIQGVKEAPDRHSKTRYKSFDCSIMELADDIAYGIHDLEDSIVMGIVSQRHFEEEVVAPIEALDVPWLSGSIKSLSDKLFSNLHHVRKNAIGALVNCFITAIEIKNIEPRFDSIVLSYNAVLPDTHCEALAVFKSFVYHRVIGKPEVQILRYKGQQVVMELFEAFASDPLRLLPDNTRRRWHLAEENNNGLRVIADYISGMTDEFSSRLYTNMFSPKHGSLWDNLGN